MPDMRRVGARAETSGGRAKKVTAGHLDAVAGRRSVAVKPPVL